ncbi:MAG: DUF2809 domain-containing protein [Maribacter sp.]|uniref:ribosomal maturation YjgA family protein n=1 Tax=Maribacter sp. 2307UL18-2 TaxID=3386274 RepID=UPI0039BC5F66
MKFTLNTNYLILAVLLFLIEVAIATFFKSGFIRHTFGDFLVVILLYCFFKGFVAGKSISIAMVTLCIAFAIEFLQLTDFLQHLGIKQYRWANLIFGNSFSVQDLVAYILGIAVVIILEKSLSLGLGMDSRSET